MLRRAIDSLIHTATQIFCVAVAASFLYSCSLSSNEYAAYCDFGSDGWRYNRTIHFRPEHPDSICRGRLAVALRHDGDFPYKSVWVETTVSDAGTSRTDTLEIPLADRFGAWQGHGIGSSYQVIDTVPRSFTHVSGHLIGVRQIMRADTLHGITQLGIFFIPDKP